MTLIRNIIKIHYKIILIRMSKMLKKLAFKRKIDQKTIIISLIKKILTNSKNDSNNEHNKNPL